MKKRLFLVIGLSLVLIFVAFRPNAQSRTKVYYSGEAVSYNNNLVFATVNTGALELFVLDNDRIVRTAMFKPRFVSLPKSSENYSDLCFSNVNGKLYLYLIDGAYLYKFDVSNLYDPKLLEKIKDNSWDWFLALDKSDEYLVSIGTNNIKFWNHDLEVVNTFKINYDKPENVTVSRNGDYIFTIIDNVLNVYCTEERKEISKIWLKSKEVSIRGVKFDEFENKIYVTDDEALKVFDIKGNLVNSFKHTSEYGYDVELSNQNTSLYFSDGIGIVRNDRYSLKAIDWKYTTKYTEGSSWTMGIEVVSDNLGDKIVAFNNSEIPVLNKNLELIDLFKSSSIDEGPIEKLYLVLDKNNAGKGEYVTVNGGGFFANEELKITMDNSEWNTLSDSNGRFKRTIEVIDIEPQMIDIKVEGLSSGLTYSISFKVD